MSENSIVKVESGLTLKEKMTLADILAKSGRFAGDVNAAQAIVKIQAGAELGIPPIQSMTNIHIVNGRITLGATVIAALIKGSGRYDYKIKKLDETSCELDFYEHGEFVGTSNFTMDDAKTAGLTNKDVWKKFPRNMLFSRAVSNGARWYTASIFGGAIYTPEELEDGDAQTESKKSRWQVFVETSEDKFGLNEAEVKTILKENGHSQFNFENWNEYELLLSKHSKVVDGEVS